MRIPLPNRPRLRVITIILGVVAIAVSTASMAAAQDYMACDCGVQLSVLYPMSYPYPTGGMPSDVAAAYDWFDSVARHYTLPQVVTGLGYRTSLTDDTLKRALHYAYVIKDYDPLLFLKYQDADSVRYSGLMTQPMDIWTAMLVHLRSITPDDSTGMRLRSLIQASYVLRVKVNNVTTHTDSTTEWAQSGIIVQAVVLDTIKGKVFPLCTLPLKTRGGVRKQTGDPCISFEYRAEWSREDPYIGHAMSQDSVLGSNWMKADSEYVVFVNMIPVGRDSSHVIATLSPLIRGTSGGMYPIEGGNVKDVNNDFGWGASVPVATFISLIRGKINEITSW